MEGGAYIFVWTVSTPVFDHSFVKKCVEPIVVFSLSPKVTRNLLWTFQYLQTIPIFSIEVSWVYYAYFSPFRRLISTMAILSATLLILNGLHPILRFLANLFIHPMLGMVYCLFIFLFGAPSLRFGTNC